ncbi:MAG: sodium/proline symporter [Candidatus Latescibacterota bacterium]|nr:MAG: sodium/proline symporter [Candidatus Latescibacterota bacterium]
MQETPSTILIVSFSIYTIGIVMAGLISARFRKDTTDDFYLASRELGPWASALSASASSESGWVMLGLVGAAFTGGVSTLWLIPGCAAGYFFNWYFVADRVRRASKKTGAQTLPELLASRFGERAGLVRGLSLIIIGCAMIAYVSAQMSASGKAFEAMFSLPYWVGVVLGAGVIMAYTITGGFRASVWTDVVQSSFMVLSLIAIPLVMLTHIGGLAGMVNGLRNTGSELLSFSAGNAGFGLLGFVLGWLAIGWGYPGQPHVLARFMGTRDSRAVRTGGVVAITWSSVVFLGAITLGLAARVYFGSLDDPEQALPLVAREFMPPVLGGFVLAAIMAAIWSTADSQLLVVASTATRDLRAFFDRSDSRENTRLLSGPDRRYGNVNRRTVFVLGLTAAVLAVSETRVIFTFVLYAWSVLGASFGPVIILGLAWKKTTRQGAIGGLLVGSIVSVVWKNIGTLSGALYEIVPAFLLSFASVIVVSLVTQPKLIPEENRRASGNLVTREGKTSSERGALITVPAKEES